MQYDRKELETLLYLQEIIEAYEEIASIRMQKVKKSVLSNREFLEGLRKLAIEVRTSYKKELAKVKKRNNTTEIRKTNGKTVAVMLSSNTGLYGEIVNKVFRDFMEYADSHPESDLVIVGKTGMRMYESTSNNKEALQFELSDSYADKENIAKILNYVIDYKDIIVFHGLFVDMLKQDPHRQVLTGEQALEEGSAAPEVKHREYIFEPSLEALVAYFEQEILRSMFKHAIHESSLSKYASRMISLDRATERINDKIDESKLASQRSKHRIQSRKQNSTLASMYGRLRRNA